MVGGFVVGIKYKMIANYLDEQLGNDEVVDNVLYMLERRAYDLIVEPVDFITTIISELNPGEADELLGRCLR